MILTRVSKSLLPFMRPMNLYIKGERQKDGNGEFQDGLAVKLEINWPTTNVSSRQFQLSSDGAYTTEDRNFFQLQTSEPLKLVKQGDEFEFKTVFFVVKDIKDMLDECGYIRYVCKKKTPQTAPGVLS